MRDLAGMPRQLRSIAAESGILYRLALLDLEYGLPMQPVELMAGAADALFNAELQADLLSGMLGDPLVEIIPDAEHMLHHAAPQAVRQMIDAVCEASG